MTQLTTKTGGDNGGITYIYGRKAVQAGSRSVKIYYHGGTTYGSFGTLDLAGVSQTTPTGSVATAAGASVSITNTTGNWVVSALTGNNGIRGVTPTSGTQAWIEQANGGGINSAMSYKSATGTTMAWTGGGYYNGGIAAVVINVSP
jgi:hypothetical protein